ncbi:MAG: glycosyltransferase family 2 protein [Bacteroidota bacterium]
MQFPLVTVGVPTYNRPLGLKKCLEHLLLQTYPNLEIIISDNHSPDPEVQKTILDFTFKDKRISQFRQTENIGLENNFNFLYARSKAPYFIWMSDDDYFESDYIEKCVVFLEKNPDHVLCSGTAKYYSDDKFIFEEKMFKVDQRTAFRRINKYFAKVDKNANFYGVFRNGLLTKEPLGNHVGCDWSFMGKLTILGKLTFINTTSYHRSAEGNSGTRKKLVTKFKLNRLQNIFFETYSAYIISTHIFNDKIVNAKFNFLGRRLIITMIFFQINYKLFFKFLRKVLG